MGIKQKHEANMAVKEDFVPVISEANIISVMVNGGLILLLQGMLLEAIRHIAQSNSFFKTYSATAEPKENIK